MKDKTDKSQDNIYQISQIIKEVFERREINAHLAKENPKEHSGEYFAIITLLNNKDHFIQFVTDEAQNKLHIEAGGLATKKRVLINKEKTRWLLMNDWEAPTSENPSFCKDAIIKNEKDLYLTAADIVNTLIMAYDFKPTDEYEYITDEAQLNPAAKSAKDTSGYFNLVELLEDQPTLTFKNDPETTKRILIDSVKEFKLPIKILGYYVGPTFTRYLAKFEKSLKYNQVQNAQDTLSSMLGFSVKISEPGSDSDMIEIDIPNKNRAFASFKSMLKEGDYTKYPKFLNVPIGVDVEGKIHTYNIASMPNLLIAGATGSGKTTFLNTVISKMLMGAAPEEVKLILVDPKRIEFGIYEGLSHLQTPVIHDLERAIKVFEWAEKEMVRRTKLLEKYGIQSIAYHNVNSKTEKLPYILIIVDEFSELMDINPYAIERIVSDLAPLSKNTGIHIILATCRPGAHIISGMIKSSMPCRIAFKTNKQIDSRVIIDQAGAEKLLGKGDLLFADKDSYDPVRLQAPYISEKDMELITKYARNRAL